ncbi:hypothetical protein BD413DRAFT_678644, partial [Trametes elegans]
MEARTDGAIAPTRPGPSIIPLPSSTQSRLRSTQILTSLPQIVSELVQNSLDAGAQTIAVAVDPDEWECWVSDDGAGISRDGLALFSGGCEGSRYGTSKAYTQTSLDEVSTFGFRGEALASAADVACLEISSRTKHSRESQAVILKGGKTLYLGPSIHWRKQSPGTVVSVRDAFYNLPIRRQSHTKPSRTIELVKREIESFALVFPNVSFSLDATHKAKAVSVPSKARVLTIPKTQSTLAAFRRLYGRALADNVEEIQESSGGMRLEGFLSLQGAHSKAYQFLYVNKHPLATCDLHRHVESTFARSSFNKHAYDELGKTHTPLSAVRRSPRKTEKKPVYVLNFIIPPRFVDNCIEPAKAAVQLQDSTAVNAFLTSVIERILVRHGFMVPPPERTNCQEGVASPRKRRKLVHRSHSLDPPRMHPSPRTYDPTATSQPFPPVPEREVVIGGADDATDILWTDPATGERFIIDARTGNSYPQHAPARPRPGDNAAGTAPAGARMILGTSATTSARRRRDAPAWIAAALQANEAYHLTERKIPPLSGAVDRRTQSTARACGRARATHARVLWDAPRAGRFAGAGLREARVLGQVDQKFVACVIPASLARCEVRAGGGGGPGNVEGCCSGEEAALVLIDQHAADERVRVERFLREVCEGFLASRSRTRGDGGHGGVDARPLVPPVNVLLTGPEAKAIMESFEVRTAFSYWGITFDIPPIERKCTVSPNDGEAGYAQVAVSSVPNVVADKA